MADVLVDKRIDHDDLLLAEDEENEAFKDWKSERLAREAAYYDQCRDEQ